MSPFPIAAQRWRGNRMEPGLRARRAVLLLGAALPVCAQAASGTSTLGFLAFGDRLSGREPQRPLGALLRHLLAAGWVEGRNLKVDALFAEGRPEALSLLAQQLVQRRPDIIVVQTAGVAEAVLEHTTTIPVVAMAAGQLEAEPQVESMLRPGRNLTGMQLNSPEVIGKRLQLLHELVPGLKRVAVLRGVPFDGPGYAYYRDATEAAAGRLGIRARYLQFREPAELDTLFAGIALQDQAALTWGNPHLYQQRPRIAALAVRHRLPMIHDTRYVGRTAEDLMVYSALVDEAYRDAATYVDRILRGARAGDLPIGRARNFELLVNLRVAKAIGLTVPPALLARADEVLR